MGSLGLVAVVHVAYQGQEQKHEEKSTGATVEGGH